MALSHAQAAGWASTDAYAAETGWIDRAKIERHAFPPSEDTLVLVCGPPLMYSSLCGPRTDKELKEGSVLHQLGYTSAMVSKM